MTYSVIILISFICVLAMDVFYQVSPFFGSPVWGTNLLLALNLISSTCLLVISRKLNWKSSIPSMGLLSIQMFWFWAFITFIRGAVNAHDYWDWKALLLSYLPSVFISLAVVLGINFDFCKKIYRFILLKLFPVSFIFIPFALAFSEEFYGRIVVSVCLFILLAPFLPKKWRIFVIIVAITSISMDLTYRANVLRLSIPLMLIALFYFRIILITKLMNYILIILFCAPLILLLLGVGGNFNIFAENKFNYEANVSVQGERSTSNISADTRTFLYKEVFNSMAKRNSSWMLGEGGSAGYETDFFRDYSLNEKGRFRSEVGFLNTLLYSGIIGLILYALILFLPAYYAINKSNNRLSKMIGLFLAARWVLFFVEEIAQFDMNFFFLWLMIGMCLSNRFRAMTDVQMEIYFGARRQSSLRFIDNYFSHGSNVLNRSFVRTRYFSW